MNCDLLDWIRAELQSQPTVLPLVEPVLNQARALWGGDTIYVRAPERQRIVTRRTLQRRHRAHD